MQINLPGNVQPCHLGPKKEYELGRFAVYGATAKEVRSETASQVEHLVRNSEPHIEHRASGTWVVWAIPTGWAYSTPAKREGMVTSCCMYGDTDMTRETAIEQMREHAKQYEAA